MNPSETKLFYPNVTLLITLYNRSNSIKRLLESFNEKKVKFGNIVVSDDGSSPSHLEKLYELQTAFHFNLVTTEQNKGLGNNINKGQDAVKTEFTLYVQEDFEPTEKFIDAFKDSMEFMNKNSTLDLIRYYANYQYPYTRPFDRGFSEICIPPFAMDYRKVYAYSDNPHLRRSNFFEKFGRYAEGIKGDRMEYKMCLSFIQNKGKALIYDDFKGLFLHENLPEETSTMYRSPLTVNNNLVLSYVRHIYRQVRYNYDIKFSKQRNLKRNSEKFELF